MILGINKPNNDINRQCTLDTTIDVRTMRPKEEMVTPLCGQLKTFYRRVNNKQIREGQLGINPVEKGEQALNLWNSTAYSRDYKLWMAGMYGGRLSPTQRQKLDAMVN